MGEAWPRSRQVVVLVLSGIAKLLFVTSPTWTLEREIQPLRPTSPRRETVVCKNGSSVGTRTHCAHIFFLHVWRRLACSVGALIN